MGDYIMVHDEDDDDNYVLSFLKWLLMTLGGIFIFIILVAIMSPSPQIEPRAANATQIEPSRPVVNKNPNPLASAYAFKLCNLMGKKFITHDNESIITCADRQTGQVFVYTILSVDVAEASRAMEGKF
jgi:hypothetical protein